MTDRLAAPDAGPLLWIQVERIDHALKLVGANGGEVVKEPFPDGTERWLATIRDPAGNVLGIVTNSPMSS